MQMGQKFIVVAIFEWTTRIPNLAPNDLDGPAYKPFTRAVKKCITEEILTLLTISVVALFYRLGLMVERAGYPESLGIAESPNSRGQMAVLTRHLCSQRCVYT